MTNLRKSKKQKDVIDALDKIGVYDDVLRATNGKHVVQGYRKNERKKITGPQSLY